MLGYWSGRVRVNCWVIGAVGLGLNAGLLEW